MYAVLKSGGKQYRVEKGQHIKLEKLPHEVGDVVKFDEILMIADGEKISVGTPVLSKAKVEAKVVSHGRHKKIKVLKFKRRKQYMKKQGHRQYFTELEVTNIGA
jgi:large subunit ribosomal protein L21